MMSSSPEAVSDAGAQLKLPHTTTFVKTARNSLSWPIHQIAKHVATHFLPIKSSQKIAHTVLN